MINKTWLKNIRELAKGIILLLPSVRRLYEHRNQLLLKNLYRGKSIDSIILLKANENLSIANSITTSMPGLGSRWADYTVWAQRDIKKFKTVVEATRFAQVQMGFECRMLPPQGKKMIEDQLASIKSIYPAFIDALKTCCETSLSLQSDPSPVIAKDGSLYTTSQLLVAGHMFYIIDQLDGIPETVLEIGGGYGTPARCWLTTDIGSLRQYVILDVPESLFFAEVFLKAHFGLDNIVNLVEPNSLDRAQKAKIVLCPLQLIGDLKNMSFDVALNSGSMQEMTDDWIELYMSFLSSMDIKYFYSVNYFLQPIDNMNESMNLWSPRLDNKWTLTDFNFGVSSFEAGNRNILNAFYKRQKASEINISSIEDRIRLLEQRNPSDILNEQDGAALTIIMDAFRLGLPIDHVLRVARTLARKFPFMVKELKFLVNYLLSDAVVLEPSDEEEMIELRQELNRLQSDGNEGLSPISQLVS